MGHEMRFRSLLTAMLLLIVFVGHSNATKPRKAGIGVRYGFYQDFSRLDYENGKEFIRYDTEVNHKRNLLVPFKIQFNEELINDWVYTTWLASLEHNNTTDMPPAGPNYSHVNFQSDYIVDTTEEVSEFKSKFPQYSEKINSANNPSLSADFEIYTLHFGKLWGVFIPIGERNRILGVGLGLGVAYMEGRFSVNICDPYVVESKISPSEDIIFNDYRKGICNKKEELFHNSISNFEISYMSEISLYSYIGEKYEINFINIRQFWSNIILKQQDSPVQLVNNTSNVEVISVIYKL